MSGPLIALKNVAALDAQIFDLETKAEQIPERIRQHQQAQEEARRRLAAKDAALKDLRAKTELREKDLQAAEQGVIKLRNQINEARSNKEFQTLQHEILSKEADNARLEDAVLAAMQKVDKEKEDRDALAAEIEKADEEFAETRKGLEAELEEINGRVRTLREQRREAAKEVPADIAAKYERLISRRGQTAMVAVVNGACQGCFMNLRPETMAQLKKGTDLVTCHSCGRILYLEEPEPPET
jgi:predicted  nucleic acid-binding Zn-ribbon protein